MNYDSITISEKNGNVFLQCFFNTSSHYETIFEERLTSLPCEILENLTGYSVLGDSEIILDKDNLATYEL